MRLTAKEIIADFDAHLQKSSKQYYSNFYVGITNDIERRLFTEHNVSKENAWWIYRTATDKATAQRWRSTIWPRAWKVTLVEVLMTVCMCTAMKLLIPLKSKNHAVSSL